MDKFASMRMRVIREDMDQIRASLPTAEKLRGKSVYITGATGMIASYIVYFLLYLNETAGIPVEIYAGARKREKAQDRFGAYMERPYFHFIRGDVSDEIEVERRFDYIIHAASLASPQYYGKMPVNVILPNVVGTWRLLEHARRYGCDGVVFFSSGSVYGEMDQVRAVGEDMYGRMDFLAPGNCYGESKRLGEALCLAYFRQYDIPTKAVRIFHTYGPTMDIHNDARVFSEFMRCLVEGRDIVMKSDGTSSRAFLYLSDAVSGILTILLEGAPGGCYNMGNPWEYRTVAELAHMVAGLSEDKKIQVRMEKRTLGIDYQPSPESRKAVMDVSRLERLGWKPHVSAQEGFTRCYRFFRENET